MQPASSLHLATSVEFNKGENLDSALLRDVHLLLGINLS